MGRGRFSRKFPNIRGRLSYLTTFADISQGEGSLYYYAPTKSKMQTATLGDSTIPSDPSIDASRSSALYQDNLTEIRVNALYGLKPTKSKMQTATLGDSTIPSDPSIDASRSSALYQDNLTEIRVNALYGLNLIRAF